MTKNLAVCMIQNYSKVVLKGHTTVALTPCTRNFQLETSRLHQTNGLININCVQLVNTVMTLMIHSVMPSTLAREQK